MTFGELLKRFREERGFTLRDLGKLSGIDHAYIYRLETGEKETPSNEIVKTLTRALKLDSRRAHIWGFLVRQPVADDLVNLILEEPEYSPGDFESAAQMSFRGARPRGKDAWRKLLHRIQEMREEFERDK